MPMKTGLEGECSKKVLNSGLLMQTLERWVAALSRTSRAFLSVRIKQLLERR
ncbi:hypothetical protein H0484_00945 [Pusillimonas sp. CC-YST705]|uniref:Uncharacterized protein n=1 Tax=Mesopusillimonas faecipullorum TaxID=2755040 RepID=A0ABS8C916_9BURK|nr:hypothetical protein [Mesopusillimonas faecipullorum]MCB5362327.1 hypothetical protein [Mesopusillimonas faecipullorum]